MEGDTGRGCKGDASDSGPAFSRADKMRFNTLTYEIIEELKMRRELAVENEKKIEKLMTERYNMGWKLDQECGKVANLGERHEAELRETRRELEEKMRDYQLEASQQQVYRKMAEKEKDALKDEIRRLQLANYTLEKKVRESECHEKIQANEREQHIHQVSRFESQFNQVDAMMKQLTSKQDQLDTDMKHVKNLNKSLQYQNSHQKCILDMKEADLLKVTQELLDTKVKVKVEPGQVQEREEELQNEARRLKGLVNKVEEDYSNLEKDKDSWKEKYWDSLKKLDNTHRLINVHLHNAAKYKDECEALGELQKATQDKLNKTKNSLQLSREEINDIQHKHQTEVENFEPKICKLNEEIVGLNTEVSNMSEQKDTTEQILQEAKDTIADLEKQLTRVMAILNVEKFQAECQTRLQMLEMLDSEVQAIPTLQNQEVQVRADEDTGVTQTIDPALCSTDVQTDFVEHNVKEVQTECTQKNMKSVKDAVIQTDLDIKGYDTSVYSSCTDKNDGVESNAAIYIEDSPEKVMANIKTDPTQIYKESSCEKNAHDTAQKKFMQDMRLGEYMSTVINVDCNDNSGRFDFDRKIDVSNNRSEQNLNHQENPQLKEIRFEKAHPSYDTKVETGKGFSTQMEPNQKVHSEILRNDRIGIYKDLKSGKFMLNSSKRNEAAKVGSESHDLTLENQEIGITSNLNLYKEEASVSGKEIGGMSIPRIDIAKSINSTSVVAVDPDEFSIELTQDEKASIDSHHHKKEKATEGKLQTSPSIVHFNNTQSSSSHQIETTSFEQLIEQKWEISEKSSKVTKSKAKKHKLTKEIVQDNFTDFDRNKEKFTQYLNRDEVQPKHQKLNEIEKNQQRGITMKHRKYSSMFQVQEEIEKIDESDTEEMIPEVKKLDLEYHDLSENVKCSLTNVQCFSQDQVSANCSFQHLPETHHPLKRDERELNKSVVKLFSNIQSRVCTNDVRQSKNMPIQPISNQSDIRMCQDACSYDTSEFICLSHKQFQQGTYDIANDSKRESHLAKPATLNIEVPDVEDEIDSPNTLTQSDVSSQELNEINNPLTEEPTSNACPDSSVHLVSSIAFTAKSNEETGTIFRDSVSMVAFSTNASFEEPEAKVSKPVTSPSTNNAHQLSKFVNTDSKTNDPTGTKELKKSDISNPSSAQAGGSSDFLQKYRDIVAKIKPVQNVSSKQCKVFQKNTDHSMAPPSNTTMQEFVQKVSPRGRTPRSILKGSSKNSRKPRNVSWNEYVLNKDFVRDDNTSDAGS